MVIMMRMMRLIGTLNLALALSACGGDMATESSAEPSDSASQRELIAVSILSPTAWWLRVDTDGSGQLGYGSAFQDTARFAAGTFRLRELSGRLEEACSNEGSLERDTAVTFVAAMGKSAESLYCSDATLIGPIFDRAVDGANLSGTRLDELYSAQPPLPM